MSGTMIAGIILFAVGVLVLIAGITLASAEGDGYVFLGVIICVIGITLMIGTACEAAMTNEKKNETLYPLAVKVSTIDREADVVECVDGAGNVWKFFGCEDWQEGDFAALLMNDKGTLSIYDDEIITARYAGTFEG